MHAHDRVGTRYMLNISQERQSILSNVTMGMQRKGEIFGTYK